MNLYKKTLFIIVFFLISAIYSEDLEFFNSMIDSYRYDLSRNYGKGCEIFKNKNIDFQSSKRILKTLYLMNSPVEYYCSCEFFINKDNKLIPETKNCGYKPRSTSMELMINWEHIMPAHRFGNLLDCWNQKICTRESKGKVVDYKGRKCCQKINPCFNIMEGDVHNLVPSLFELNLERQNYFFGDIPGEARNYGKCNFEVQKKQKIVEIPENISGDFTRAYLYMAWMYGIKLDEKEKNWLRKWNEHDPPDDLEKKMNSLKAKIQGNENPFISYYKIK